MAGRAAVSSGGCQSTGPHGGILAGEGATIVTERIQPLITATDIAQRLQTLAGEIAPHIGATPLIVAILKGSLVFCADLIRQLGYRGVRPTLDVMVLSSYGCDTSSSGHIQVQLDCREEIKDRQVLLLDDILDSGLTLHFASQQLRQRGAATLHTAVLLDKPERRKIAMQADFVGFTIPNLFVVGYGIDYAERYRELPDIGQLMQE
ncbi:MAG: hypoxanthine phosphoribosyltransferase [Magnetococcales bacterium]|nr:hypoxanthine phosphoribosyltransferase [Magnetococcales bacterium]